MRRTIENIVIGILIVSLLLAVLGVILTNEALTKAAFVVLMIVALAYTVLQVLDYFDALKNEGRKTPEADFLVYGCIGGRCRSNRVYQYFCFGR